MNSIIDFFVAFYIGLIGFFGVFSGYLFVFLALLIAIHISLILTVKQISTTKYIWFVYLGIEIIAIVWAMFASDWGTTWAESGYGAILIPRVAILFYALEMVETVVLWLCYRNRKVAAKPAESNLRNFCGDI